MAQGLLKKSTKTPQTHSSHHNSAKGVTKKGSLRIKPKKATLQKQAKMNKKMTSGLTAQTERMLGEKAGHMELIGKGRSKSKDAAAAGGKKEGGKGKK